MNKYHLQFKMLMNDTKAVVVAILSALGLGVLLFYFTDYATTVGNLGLLYTNTHVVVQVILALLFGINAGIMFHKMRLSTSKQSGVMAAGSFLAIMTGGCAACGVTLASLFGLGSVFAALPFYGLEVKVASLGLLLYSTHILCDNNCKLEN